MNKLCAFTDLCHLSSHGSTAYSSTPTVGTEKTLAPTPTIPTTSKKKSSKSKKPKAKAKNKKAKAKKAKAKNGKRNEFEAYVEDSATAVAGSNDVSVYSADGKRDKDGESLFV